MNILITGAKGFVGRNLAENLKNIRDNKYIVSNIKVEEIYEVDVDTCPELLTEYCSKADFVFSLAGVNRSENSNDFIIGNRDFIFRLLEILKEVNNTCPIMFASSIQATLLGKYKHSIYGESKLEGEKICFKYEADTGVPVFVYRFPNLFGKWCRPNYNSVVATFCNNIANDLPIHVENENTMLELVYIDDLIHELINLLKGHVHRCEYGQGVATIENENGKYCYVPKSYNVTLGELVNLLYTFKRQPDTLILPSIPSNSFSKKLYSTYLSYLPESSISKVLKMNTDDRGSFTELIKTLGNGQVSVNICKPGITKGNHWHNSKWEIFIVVAGHGLIRQRDINTGESIECEVSGKQIECVYILPGYTHSITNLSSTDELITVMWANEEFNSQFPDTFHEEV